MSRSVVGDRSARSYYQVYHLSINLKWVKVTSQRKWNISRVLRIGTDMNVEYVIR